MIDPQRIASNLILGAAALACAGCPEQPPSIESTTTSFAAPIESQQSIEDEKLRLHETEEQALAVEEIVREPDLEILAKQSKEVFILEIQNAISDAEYRIQQLRKKGAKLEGDARRSMDETIDEMEAAVARVADGLAKVIGAEALEWEDFREEVEQAVLDLDSIREPSRT
jgi:hypothetical protein